MKRRRYEISKWIDLPTGFIQKVAQTLDVIPVKVKRHVHLKILKKRKSEKKYYCEREQSNAKIDYERTTQLTRISYHVGHLNPEKLLINFNKLL